MSDEVMFTVLFSMPKAEWKKINPFKADTPFGKPIVVELGNAMEESDRRLRMLQRIATQNYDAGYTAENFAEYACDPKFDDGDC